MKAFLLAGMCAAALPLPLFAQRYDYHLLLDSTAPAASAVLVANGHRVVSTSRRADGFTERSFATVLPDSAGAPALGDLRVVIVSRGDSITRIGLHASAGGADSVGVKVAAQFFVDRLSAVYGRSLSGEGDWCWSTRRRFVSVTLDRAYGEVSLTLGYGPQDR